MNKKILIFLLCITVMLLLVSCDKPRNNQENNKTVATEHIYEQDNNRIVIKRIDGSSPLKMSNKYADKIIEDEGLYRNEISKVIISTAGIEESHDSMAWGLNTDDWANMDADDALDIFKAIKCFKGITDISTIYSDKKDVTVTIYDRFSNVSLTDPLYAYTIIPSSLTKFVKLDLALNDTSMTFSHKANSRAVSCFRIMGEYKTDNEYDTIYASYPHITKIIKKSETDMSEYIDSIEIELNEGKDYTNLIEYLKGYFADANALDEYQGKTNKFDEPYLYEFELVMNCNN
ncbi:MAG TPA: hypothetical protein PLZ06_01700 [Clostridia bacterium]|nr:hypothetical protein [Clostridia bacterium]HQC67634.1 hypothetical protein [Clostridia bacterium]